MWVKYNNNQKKLIFSWAILLFLVSCEKKEVLDVDPLELTGTWQLVAQNIGSPGDHSWADVENGHTYTFRQDGTFTSTRIPACETGMYQEGTRVLSCGKQYF